ncbi:DUF6054 family protein [Clostridia bacterium OttesenSCG-928-F22]|nr:DUF6054 family protein [Clostridia bacterium OttesenSCG-928-F22]
MAKYERIFIGDFGEMLWLCHSSIMKSSTASYETGSDYQTATMRVAIRVYERYSILGGNRVSLSLTLIDDHGRLFLSAITSGGSQATFFKINTWGEESFLSELQQDVERYCANHGV